VLLKVPFCFFWIPFELHRETLPPSQILRLTIYYILLGTWFHPAVNPPTFFIPEGPDGNEDEVNKGPDTETSQGEDHQDGRSGLSQIKTVGSENPEKEA
jgi:hypothetical protein